MATAPEGLADLRPRGSRCWSPTRGPAHRRRSIPLCRSSPLLNKGCPPPHYPPERWALQRGRYGWVRVRDPRTHKVMSFTVRNAYTDTCGYTRPAVALSTVSPFQSPQPHGPSCGHFSPVGVDRGGRRAAARPGEAWISRAAREVPSFPSLVPGAPRKRAAQPPPPRSHRRRAAPGFNQFRIEPGQRRSQGERWREQGDRRRERE